MAVNGAVGTSVAAGVNYMRGEPAEATPPAPADSDDNGEATDVGNGDDNDDADPSETCIAVMGNAEICGRKTHRGTSYCILHQRQCAENAAGGKKGFKKN
jgi:hypothetical protein